LKFVREVNSLIQHGMEVRTKTAEGFNDAGFHLFALGKRISMSFVLFSTISSKAITGKGSNSIPLG
jgi:hypothetical protein